MNYGLLPAKIETAKEGADHVLGSANLAERVINPTGDWEQCAPDREPQNVNGVETNSCTYQGTNTALEALDRFLGETTNYSDRYTANIGYQLGKLDPLAGANPHDTAEVIRTASGQIPEADAPWGTPYYSLDTTPFKEKALKWYEKRKVAHKWVFNGGTPMSKRVSIKDALTKGTVCVSVSAWHKKDGLYYKPEGASDNHWVWLMSANGAGPYKILDSYEPYVKELDPMFDFSMAKVYFYRPLPFLKNLYFGMTHPDVSRLQRELIALGYPIRDGVTHFYGSQTLGAVWQFQQSVGIADDGSHFGPRTRNALNKKLNPDDYFGGSLSTFLLALFSAS